MMRWLMALIGVVGQAWADKPTPWQMGFQEAVTPVMHQVNNLHNTLLIIITVIAIIVSILMIVTIVRFREKNNKTPSKRTHHLGLEIVWTLIPVLILVGLAMPSVRLIYRQEKIPEAAITIKAIGHQWYWSYEYPDLGVSFDSYVVPDNELKAGQLRLLDVDNPVVVPVGQVVRVVTTSTDVVHSFAVPSFGVKKDSVPGRLNETWFQVEKEGTYYGQCSELCGAKHGMMPIMIQVVSEPEFKTWVKSKGGSDGAAAKQKADGAVEKARTAGEAKAVKAKATAGTKA